MTWMKYKSLGSAPLKNHLRGWFNNPGIVGNVKLISQNLEQELGCISIWFPCEGTEGSANFKDLPRARSRHCSFVFRPQHGPEHRKTHTHTLQSKLQFFMDHMIYIYIYHELKRVFQSIFRQDQTRPFWGVQRFTVYRHCATSVLCLRLCIWSARWEIASSDPRWVSCDCWPTMPPSFSWLTPYHFMSDKFSQFLFGVNITIGF